MLSELTLFMLWKRPIMEGARRSLRRCAKMSIKAGCGWRLSECCVTLTTAIADCILPRQELPVGPRWLLFGVAPPAIKRHLSSCGREDLIQT